MSKTVAEAPRCDPKSVYNFYEDEYWINILLLCVIIVLFNSVGLLIFYNKYKSIVISDNVVPEDLVEELQENSGESLPKIEFKWDDDNAVTKAWKKNYDNPIIEVEPKLEQELEHKINKEQLYKDDHPMHPEPIENEVGDVFEVIDEKNQNLQQIDGDDAPPDPLDD